MRPFHSEFSLSFLAGRPIIAILISVFCGLVTVGIAGAQQATVRQTNPLLPSAISPSRLSQSYEIRQRFLTQQQAALIREFRQVQRCLEDAQRNLRDVRGQINRTAQTDLENCAKRAEELQRESRILERKGVRLGRQIQSEFFILQGLLKDFQLRRALAGASSRSD